MMQWLVATCLRWRFLVLVAMAIVVTLGVRAALRLPIDAVPDITNVQVQVLTSAPALGPIDIERAVTAPVERAMSGLPGMKEVRSISRYGLSAVTVVFEDGADLTRARQLVRERVDIAKEQIPPGLEPPELGPLSSGLGEVFQFEVHADNPCAPGAPDTEACWTPMELRTVLDRFVAFQLRNVRGVIEVNSFGGELETWEVRVDPDRLVAHGLSLAEVYRAIEDNQGMAGGGSFSRAGEQTLIRGEGRLRRNADIERIRIATRGEGVAVRVADIGTVAVGPMLRQGAVTRDGRGEIVSGIVMMLLGENGREVVHGVKDKLAEIAPSLPDGVTIQPFYDRAELVMRTIETVAFNLAEGALFVVGVLFLLLGTLRGGLIVALSIPFAMLVAFIGMDALGLSGNLMSLGAIDFGIVVDGSIIVVENAVVYLAAASRGLGRPLTYAEASRAVLGSTLAVRRATTFGEGIIVLVYVPILTLSGIEGRMFGPMAMTVLFALGGAFFASLTFVPLLVATFMRKRVEDKHPLLVRLLHKLYAPLLARTMRVPALVAGVALALLAVAGWRLSGLGVEFVPRLDEGSLAVQIMRLPSVSLEESIAGATRFEQVVKSYPEVDTVVCKTGRPEIATDPMGVEISDCFIMLRPPKAWTTADSREALVEHMERRFERELPGLGFSFSQPIELRMAELISGTRSDVALTVHGDDLRTLARLSGELQRALSKVAGASDVRGEQLAGLPTLEVQVDPQQANRFGVSAQDVLDLVAALGGRHVGEVWPVEGIAERRVPLVVRLPAELRQDAVAIGRLPVRGDGPSVPLAQVASVDTSDQPVSISRAAIARKTAIEVNVRGRDLGGFVAEAREVVAREVALPAGYTLSWGGQYESLTEAAGRLAFAVPAALLLIFVMLYLAFGAIGPALLIYLNVPFAAVGGVFLLELRGMPLSISAAVGFIALFGIAVLNGVVLVSTIKQLRAEGMSAVEAAHAAADRRLRAVFMTASVAALGFLPMALSTSAGAEVQRPLATVVIGGLVTATLLTLFVVPTLYGWFFGRAERRAAPS
ncbi:MAG: efflux RND transporter permease subunit [Deltaproteobacteria bacterium]|nr:efflux RND transporter permease subunit [Deltaproteobacteria bacterium]